MAWLDGCGEDGAGVVMYVLSTVMSVMCPSGIHPKKSGDPVRNRDNAANVWESDCADAI